MKIVKLDLGLIYVFILKFAFVFHIFASSSSPNILFILLDDFGWKDASYMGSDFYETPHIDRLAAEGMIFTNAYAAAANCAPSRASLLSGQYASRHKIYNVGTGPRGDRRFRKLRPISGTNVLNPKIKTWAQLAQKTGYQTAIIGKWHLSSDPVSYGFDINIAGSASGSPPKGYYPPHPHVPGLENALNEEYLTDRLTNETIAFIQKSKQPWFVFLSHFAVHTPLQPKKELLVKYENKVKGKLHNHVTMATMIEAVDAGIGRIRDFLESKNMLKDTIVIFFSDNGGYGPATNMSPLKGYKGTFYEGGIRVPFFVRWQGVVPSGTHSNEPIIGVDLFPTLCAMMGASLPFGQIIDGCNLLPLFKRDISRLPARAIYWHFPAYLQSYQRIDQQRDPLFRTRPCSILREGNWKLHHYFEEDAVELYDLSKDIGEAHNLANVNTKKAATLLAKLHRWRMQTQADIPTQLNPHYDADAEQSAKAIHRQQNGNK